MKVLVYRGLRLSFSTHAPMADDHIPTVQELSANENVRTTMIDTHVLNRGGRGVSSPADGLNGLPPGRLGGNDITRRQNAWIRARPRYD